MLKKRDKNSIVSLLTKDSFITNDRRVKNIGNIFFFSNKNSFRRTFNDGTLFRDIKLLNINRWKPRKD